MVLPAGINKASGLKAAAKELDLSLHNVVGIGDAENDHAFMSACECSVAVANALPTIKERADFVTQGDHGKGVIELVDKLLANDLGDLENSLRRHHILIGTRDDGEEVRMPPHGVNLLLAGSSGSGKTTLATGLFERLVEQEYQVCILDPEADYENLEGAVTLGNSERAPTTDEVLQLLERPETNAVVNLLGIPFDDRPVFFLDLLSRLLEIRARNGRPHWLVVDEAHHVLPSSWEPASQAVPQQPKGIIFVTVHPNEVVAAALSLVSTMIAVGEAPATTVRKFCNAVGHEVPVMEDITLQPGQGLLWSRGKGVSSFLVNIRRAGSSGVVTIGSTPKGNSHLRRAFTFAAHSGSSTFVRRILFFFCR